MFQDVIKASRVHDKPTALSFPDCSTVASCKHIYAGDSRDIGAGVMPGGGPYGAEWDDRLATARDTILASLISPEYSIDLYRFMHCSSWCRVCPVFSIIPR